jgi:putative oxidoreductase
LNSKKIIPLSLRLVLGAVFAISGFQKLSTPWQNFAAVIEQYELLKGPAAAMAAQTLPWVEFLSGVFFLLGLLRRVSFPALWAMNTLFVGVLASALLRKLPIDSCGCFGQSLSLPLPAMLALDVFFWALFLVYFLWTRRFGDDSAWDRRLERHA